MPRDWRQSVVSPETSIIDTVAAIDKSALGIALIADSQRKLLGVVTDGDVRRAIIRRVSLQAPIQEIMNASPYSAHMQDSREAVLRKMKHDGVQGIPILNHDGIIEDYITLQQLAVSPEMNNPVLLMAGGLGTRLMPLTEYCPKPLLKVGGKPILESILDNFIEQGFWNFHISVRYMADRIIDYFGDGTKRGVSITYLHEDTPLGTGGALSLLPDSDDDLPVILMNGDILTKTNFVEFLAFHKKSGAAASLGIKDYHWQIPYGVVSHTDSFVRGIIEKPRENFSINAGMYVINRNIIRNFEKDTPVDMPHMLEHLIAEGQKVAAFPITDFWLDIGQMPDFERAQKEYSQLFAQ